MEQSAVKTNNQQEGARISRLEQSAVRTCNQQEGAKGNQTERLSLFSPDCSGNPFFVFHEKRLERKAGL
jgi:hypothetical protein